ncbi:stage 0 sporulation family protein [Chloroflexota bacterium]
MAEIVGIRFRKAGKIYYFDPTDIDLKVDEYVVVETARGLELGYVVIAPKQVVTNELTAPLKPVVRRAEESDIRRVQGIADKEEKALAECNKLVKELDLSMKLISAEYNLDKSQLTFFFSAEERVDFRELVRKLTGQFKARVELRQIGPRDEAKIVGGLGKCGRLLCCESFLSEFAPVSIKMAKEQNLSLNPMKISGLCGRLLCCLGYESAQYQMMKAKMPRTGQQVSTPMGPAKVTGVNPLKESVSVELETQVVVEFPVNEITPRGSEPPKPKPEEKEKQQ